MIRLPRRSLLLTFALAVAACVGGPPSTPVGAEPLPLEIRSTAMPFKIDDPAAKQIGKLIWRGGISLLANSRHFGGWSDLVVSPDNRSLTAISDVGSWLTATIERDAKGDLVGLGNGRIGPLRDLAGRQLVGKQESDAEGMALMPDGSWLVSFEGEHRIWHYPTLEATPRALNVPGNFDRQPNNGGVEAITVLPDGRIVALSESYVIRPGLGIGWIGKPLGGDRYLWDMFEYKKVPDFSPTAIRLMPDGAFVVLERAFDFVRGVRVRVMRFPGEDLGVDAVIEPEELAKLASPYAVDNLEGIAATTGARGETLLWLMSDDNFNPLQRNLLLLFEIEK
ncbi:MAG: esterase-like activity of phytase family protein [Proteobacteria bacterium]|nr:esterase-like activity of phytase family protein [Pseudomonadota bacterium]